MDDGFIFLDPWSGKRSGAQAGVEVPCGWSADMRVLGNAVIEFTVIPFTV